MYPEPNTGGGGGGGVVVAGQDSFFLILDYEFFNSVVLWKFQNSINKEDI